MHDLDDLIRAFPGSPAARRELVAFRANQDPEASLDGNVEWLMFSAIDGAAVDDVQEWSDAVCDAAFPRGWEGDALGEAIAKLWQAAAKKAPRRRRRSNPAALTCPKCGGTGKIESFMHIEDGDCFRCGGTGKVDKLTPAERGMIVPPPPVGSYAVVWMHGDEAGSVNTGAPSTSFEEANWLKNRLKKEHIGTDYYVVKFDGSEWRNRQGQAFPWTTPEGRKNPAGWSIARERRLYEIRRSRDY